ncbi:MAG: hypothetical protein LBO82_07795 [Synergistaceae bacterium]|nr:hypothetical protein [Synergistaceae bacterium]
MRTMAKGFVLLFLFLGAVPASAKVYVAEPLLVPQPAYAGMRFYVYKPYNLPKDWYATFDGYPVMKNKDGVWVYGTYHGPNLTPTHYIVGSVVPSMAGLSPYIGSVQISSVTSLPESARVQPQAVRQASGVGALPGSVSVGPVPPGRSPAYMPDWLFNDRFLLLGRWKQSVDRIGVLTRPAVPVAWKGRSPKVIYAWTGHEWYQMTAREGERPADVLKNHVYTLTRLARRGGLTWYEADIPLFSQQAAVWGYYWMGEIQLP